MSAQYNLTQLEYTGPYKPCNRVEIMTTPLEHPLIERKSKFLLLLLLLLIRHTQGIPLVSRLLATPPYVSFHYQIRIIQESGITPNLSFFWAP